MNIRLCQPSDKESWIALNREFMDFEIQDDILWNDADKASDETFSNTFDEALEKPDLITLMVIEKEGKPIGFANLMTIFSVWAHGKALILDDIYVKEELQGQGIGKQALEYIEQFARERQYKRLQFQSEFTNPGALAFYTAIGYTPADMHFYVKYL